MLATYISLWALARLLKISQQKLTDASNSGVSLSNPCASNLGPLPSLSYTMGPLPLPRCYWDRGTTVWDNGCLGGFEAGVWDQLFRTSVWGSMGVWDLPFGTMGVSDHRLGPCVFGTMCVWDHVCLGPCVFGTHNLGPWTAVWDQLFGTIGVWEHIVRCGCLGTLFGLGLGTMGVWNHGLGPFGLGPTVWDPLFGTTVWDHGGLEPTTMPIH